MSDRGLSIFDHESDDAEDAETSGHDTGAQTQGEKTQGEKTQVIPVQQKDPAPSASEASPPQPRPIIPPAPPSAAPAAAPAPSPAATPATPATPAPAATTAAVSTFPVVRRNGYDRAAVDSRVRQLSSEKAGLSASLTDSEKRVLELEARLEEARTELAETSTPSYAGLGGRASTMLRLAEEEADEIREVAQVDAA